jgi:hypothetical protein
VIALPERCRLGFVPAPACIHGVGKKGQDPADRNLTAGGASGSERLAPGHKSSFFRLVAWAASRWKAHQRPSVGDCSPTPEQATIPRSCIQPLAWSAHSPSSASAPRPSARSSTKQPVSLGAQSQPSSHSSVGSELDDFEDELKEDADEHEDEIDPDVDEDENEPAPSLARRPDYLPHLLTNFLLLPLSLDEMKTNRTRIPPSQTLTHSDADTLSKQKIPCKNLL